MLTTKEIQTLLDLLREKHGPGYSNDKDVGTLQGKLSMMMERARWQERQQ